MNHAYSATPKMLHSIVIPIFNESDGIPKLHARVSAVIDSLGRRPGENFEVILVNDGSRDGSDQLLNLTHQRDPRFKIIHLSRNFGHQLAISAGLEWAKGQTVTVMDADLQDPPELIAEFLSKWREGFDVVYGKRIEREGETWFKRVSAALYYRILRGSCNLEIPLDTGDFRLMDRKVVDAFLRLRERHRYVRGLISWLGYHQVGVPYRRQRRQSGATHFPFSKMLKFAWDGITSFSALPLQIFVGIGFTGMTGTAGAWLFRALQGRAQHFDFALLFSTCLAILGVGTLGLYVVRILDEVRARPLFLVHSTRGFDVPRPMRREFEQALRSS